MNILEVIKKHHINFEKPFGKILIIILIAASYAIGSTIIKKNEASILLALHGVGLVALLIISNIVLSKFVVRLISNLKTINKLFYDVSFKKNIHNCIIYIYLPCVLSILALLPIIYFHIFNAFLIPTYIALNIIIAMAMAVLLYAREKLEKLEMMACISNYLFILGNIWFCYIFPLGILASMVLVQKGIDRSSYVELRDFLILGFATMTMLPVFLIVKQNIDKLMKIIVLFIYILVYAIIIFLTVNPSKLIARINQEYGPSYYFSMPTCKKIHQQTGIKYISLDDESCYFKTFLPSNKSYETNGCIQCNSKIITNLKKVFLGGQYHAIEINSIELRNGDDGRERLFDLTAKVSNAENFAIAIKNPHKKTYIYSKDKARINSKTIFLPDKDLLRDIIAAIPPFNRGISADTKKVNGISLTELNVGPLTQHPLLAKHSLGHFSYTNTEGECKKIIHNKNVYATPLNSSCSDNTLLFTNIEKLFAWFNDLFSFNSADSFMEMVQNKKINQFHHAKVKISNRTLDIYYLSTKLNGMPVFMAKVYPDKTSIMIFLPDDTMLLDENTLIVRNFLNVIFGNGMLAYQ